MSEQAESIDIDIRAYVATVTINRPDKANSLRIEDWYALKRAMESVGQDSSVRVVIITGAGKTFCAGIDVSVLAALQQDNDCVGRTAWSVRGLLRDLQDCITSIERCPKPVIAAINGPCIGGGVDLIAACDMRYTVDDAYFSIKETDLGLIADLGTLQRLPYVLNPGRLSELAFTGRKVFGPESVNIGLTNAAYETPAVLADEVQALATTIAQKSPLVIQGIKETLHYQRDHSVAAGLDRIATLNGSLLQSKELSIALRAAQLKQQATYEDL